MKSTQKFVSYLRVSTARQGQSGLGLEGQRASVAGFLNGGDWKLLGEFVEVESGRKADRPELEKALSTCRIHGATLVVAKLDRLSRNAHFLLGLKEAGVDFVCVDMPSANRLTVGIMAMVAEEEARMISARTKAALQAAKVRGVVLGRPNLTKSISRLGAAVSGRNRSVRARRRADDLRPFVDELTANGITRPTDITKEFNNRGIPTVRGGRWSIGQVQRLLKIMFTTAA
jgi:DNA invertase Pin-like site-specific DNA recombinase